VTDTQDQKTATRPEAAKSTLPQPGRPVPSRAYPGALIVVEGTDGSGKSTQLYLLKRWREIGGYRLHFTEWNSSPLVKSATRRGKQRRLLTPTTFSLLHAADFADRCERQIMPLLQGDYLVLADRYIYTAFARDAARGCPPRWLRNLYRFAPIPDITFYFRAPLDVAVQRILSGRRDGSWIVVRPRGKFPLVSSAHPRGIRQDGGHRQFRGTRRHHSRQQTAKADARHRGLQNRFEAVRAARG
jgi:thymidylate kinase